MHEWPKQAFDNAGGLWYNLTKGDDIQPDGALNDAWAEGG